MCRASAPTLVGQNPCGTIRLQTSINVADTLTLHHVHKYSLCMKIICLVMGVAVWLSWAGAARADEPTGAPDEADDEVADTAPDQESTEHVGRDPRRSKIHNYVTLDDYQPRQEEEAATPEYLKARAAAQRQTGLLIGGLGAVIGLGSVATGAVLLSNSQDDDNPIGGATLAGGAITVASSILLGLMISAVAED